MDRPKIKVYSLESVIAEKFEAMIFLAEANSRMKDFYDIYKLCHTFDFDGIKLQAAIKATFTRRETPMSNTPTIFTEAYPLLKDKQTQWKAFLKRTGLDTQATFKDVLDAIHTFLFPIYGSILKQGEFPYSWNHSSGQWENIK
jgi:predicted nucleotidyltransferase component of viral defense system